MFKVVVSSGKNAYGKMIPLEAKVIMKIGKAVDFTPLSGAVEQFPI